MHPMTLHAQADLWRHEAATFAALFMEGEIRSPDNDVDRSDMLLNAVMNRGLPLTTDLTQLALGPRPGWAMHLTPAGTLTLTWPHVRPLLLDAPVDLPTGWREAAAEHGLVLLFVRQPARLARPPEQSRETLTPGRRARRIGCRSDHIPASAARTPQHEGLRSWLGRGSAAGRWRVTDHPPLPEAAVTAVRRRRFPGRRGRCRNR
jgi:hypothetical protein